MAQEENKKTLEERQKAANPGGLLTEEQALQVEALKKGASEEEASLGGKLGAAREVPSESPTGASERPPEAEVAFQDVESLSVARVDGHGPVRNTTTSRTPSVVNRAIVDEERRVPISNIVAQMPEPMDQETMKEKAMELSFMKTANDPLIRPQDAYRESLAQVRNSPDVDALFQSYQQEWANKKKEKLANLLVQTANTGNAEPREVAESISRLDEVDKEYEGRLGKERVMLDAYASQDKDEVWKQNQAAMQYAYSKLKDHSDDKSFGGKALEWAGLLVPDFIKDANDLTGNSLFKTKGDLMAIVNAYQQLAPSEKPDAFDDIFERAVEAYEGNSIKLAGLLHMLHSPNPGRAFNIDASLDAADIALTAWGPVKFAADVASNAHKGTKLVRKMSEAGAKNEAAELNMLAEGKRGADSPSDAVNSSQLDAAITRSPYKMENYLMGIGTDDSLAFRVKEIKDQQAVEIMKEVGETVQRPMDQVRQADFSISLQALTKQEKEKAVGEFARKLANDVEEMGFQSYEEIGLVRQNERGFEFSYKLGGEEMTETVFWTRNDAGVFEGVNSEFKKRLSNLPGMGKLVSPELKLNSLSENVVSDVTFGGLQASAIKGQLKTIASNLDKGMSKKERQAVSELIKAGDEEQRVFSLDELRNTGVELRTGTRTYTDKEIKNYYKKAAFNQELWSLRNHALKRELEFQGAKSISYKVPGSKTEEVREFIGVPKESFAGVSDEVFGNNPILAPQLSDKLYVNGSTLNKAKLKEEGFRAVKLVEEYKVNDKKVKYALIRDEGREGFAHIDELPEEVLHRIDGYSPRNYKPGYYFVKDVNSGKTIRAFEHRANADRFRAEQQQVINNMTPEERTAAGLEKDVEYQVFRDREFNKYEALIEDANQYGGLYTGARKREPLIVDETGDRPVRLSWGESMEKYIESVSNVMPLNEYRIALKDRFVNTVNEMYKAEGKSKRFGVNVNGDEQSWMDEDILVNDTQTRNALNEMREYLKNQLFTWSKEEKAWNSFMMDVAEMMGGKPERFIASHLAHSDPMRNLHSASFHAHLGWFNLRQLYVQAQNAALAISMYPNQGMQAATKSMAMRALLRLPDDQLDAVASKMDYVPGVTGKELAEDVRAFKRSGLESSIMRVADYDPSVDGLSPGIVSKVKKLSQVGLKFYENGELFSRMTAWNIARSNWRKANPERAMDDTAIREITDETFRLHMNLQRENAATWQTNILRLPTQFMQVQAKFIEKTIGGLVHGVKTGSWSQRPHASGWTAAEASRVAAGQIVLYGTLGVPIAEQASNRIADMLGITPVEFNEKYPLAAEAVQDGAMGTFFESLGFQNQFGGDTASLWAGMDENVVMSIVNMTGNIISNDYGSDSLEEIFLGPSLNVIRRTGDAAIDTVRSAYAVWAVPTPENIGKSLLKTADDFAAITSTWSNARKLRYYHKTGAFYSKAGKVLLDREDLEGVSLRTLVAKGMGLPLDAEQSYWALSKANRDLSQDIGDTKKEFKQAMRQYFLDGNMDRLKGIQGRLLAPFSPEERREIIKDTTSDIVKQEGQSSLDEELQRYWGYMIRSGGRLPVRQDIGNIYQARGLEEEGPSDEGTE